METKKLYRSTENRVVCGVCGGIGEYFHIDPVIIRLIWILFFLLRPGRHMVHSLLGLSGWGFSVWGIGIAIYFLAAVIIPKKRQ